MANEVAEGMNEASAARMLPPGERRVLFLESANRMGRGPCRPNTRLRRLRAVRGAGAGTRWVSIVLAAIRCRHVRGRGEVRDGWARKDVRRTGRVDVGVEDARVGVAVCAWEGDSLVGRAGL